MSIATIAVWLLEAAIVFAASTLLFDVVHWLLHRWTKSRVALLRRFAGWHEMHHRFLDRTMAIDGTYQARNISLHVLPEFATTIAGTLPFFLVFSWQPVAAVAAIRIVLFAVVLVQGGMDRHHRPLPRIRARQRVWWVGPNYHAMHHVYPEQFFSSFVKLFDLAFGTACQIEGRRFLVTGASGALGGAMVKKLQRQGAIVDVAKSGRDYKAGDVERMREKLMRADVLVLAHGAKRDDCWNANHATFVELIDLFVEIGRARLVPPEVWAVGSEAELHGDLGMASMKDYAASKRAFAARAIGYYRSDEVIYRHIVPSAFASAMGWGPMSANVAASLALFFIKRGAAYVPVTLTTLAFWNYIRFRLLPGTVRA
jgi:hypothetical protein